MPRRALGMPLLVAAALAAFAGWASLTGWLWTDYEHAGQPQFRALVEGRLVDFLNGSPVEGPSLLLRAPWALLAHALGGGDLAIYRWVAVPGLAAGALFGVLLWSLRGRLLPHAGWGMAVVALAACNPMMLRALEIGHPEELIGAVLCAGAVLAAVWRKPWLAGVLLGLAIANKAWGLLAVGPVLLALDRRRLPVLCVAGAVAAVFIAPFLLVSESSRGAVLSGARTDAVFQPWQAWWFLGEHGHEIRGFFGILKHDYRAAPEWISHVSHPLVAFLAIPLSALWWWRERIRTAAALDVLLLLALIFLVRCVLDVANNVYYHLPFLMALLAWEALRSHHPPVWSLAAVSLVWLTFQELPGRVSPDVQSVVYVAWSVPAIALLAYAAYRRSAPVAVAAQAAPPAQPLAAPAPA